MDQVRLDRGADIVNLDQLDQKLWVALSCPTQGLEIDSRTLEFLDADGDGHVRPPEILAAAKWLKEILKNPETLVEGKDSVSLSNLRTDTEEGQALLASAQHILQSLGKEASVISIADTAQTADFFTTALHNGDGVVLPSTIDDTKLVSVAEDIVKCMGGVPDRSGKMGYDQATLEAFFTACSDYDAWLKVGESRTQEIFPFGDKTGDAYQAFLAVRAKIDDYFGRCRLAAFDQRALAAVNLDEKAYVEASTRDLTITADELQNFPLVLVEAEKPLSLKQGVNPAWAGRLKAFTSMCCADAGHLTEEDWLKLCGRFDAYAGWIQSKAGSCIEPLGKKRIREILSGKYRESLEKAIAEDLEVADEVSAMTRIEKLTYFHRDLHKLLNNYVSFSDFYARRGAIFQAGTLYLDGRACDMCFHVNDNGKHMKMAPMSNAFLAYVDCVRPGGEELAVACAFTAGESDNLFGGRNGIFYDREGRDWDATITKIISNPISIRQAFWSPYKKVLRGIQEAIAKKGAAADEAATSKLAAGAATAGESLKTGAAPPKPKFEVGTIAALGVAVSGITGVFTALLVGFLSLGAWIPFGIIGLLLAISGPSMFIAWMKLRTRNLGPILDANGWAVNTLTRVNIPLGSSLTELARIPAGSNRSLIDPFAPKKSIWPGIITTLVLIGALGYVLYYTNLLNKWLPDVIPAHHSEIGLKADKPIAHPGDSVTFTVASQAASLQVTETSDSNAPAALPELPVKDGKAVMEIPQDSKSSSITIHDSLSGTKIKLTIPPKI